MNGDMPAWPKVTVVVEQPSGRTATYTIREARWFAVSEVREMFEPDPFVVKPLFYRQPAVESVLIRVDPIRQPDGFTYSIEIKEAK